jgi:hypothetical protein
LELLLSFVGKSITRNHFLTDRFIARNNNLRYDLQLMLVLEGHDEIQNGPELRLQLSQLSKEVMVPILSLGLQK